MTTIQRANVVLRVKDEDVEHYVAKGYNVLDENGNVVRKACPNDMGELIMHYKTSESEIERLKSELDRLTIENADLKSKIDDLTNENAELIQKSRTRQNKAEKAE